MEYRSDLGPAMAKPLTALDVSVEANRCLYCFDAPCITACPTSIDIPRFISRIATGDLLGSARAIMEANPVGASCARVCPTEELCEGACVYTPYAAPIRIGDLQRYATDWLMNSDVELFRAAPPTGKRVAIVGAGPAGLSAARELARAGHAVTVFERDAMPGGLDTYGIVPFRLPADVSLWEAEQVRKLGVVFRTGVTVGETIAAAEVLATYDAVILACGMGNVPRLNIPGEHAAGVYDAIDVIRRAKIDGTVPGLGDVVAVIGGGNTAIDAATVSRRLGANSVTMFYRRGLERMTAYPFEIAFARSEGVEFREFAVPVRIIERDGVVTGVEIARTAPDGSARPLLGSEHIVPVSAVIRAIGQERHTALFDAFGIAHDGGVATVDAEMRTNDPRIFAAGDCMFRAGVSDAMVVEAAERGKTAAASVDRFVRMN